MMSSTRTLSRTSSSISGGHDALVEGVDEEFLGAFDHLAAFGLADVLDVRDLDVGLTRPDARDGFERRREDGRLDAVQTGGDGDVAERLAALARHFDVDAADFRRLLEVAEVEVVAEQTFGLPEYRADDVAPLDYPVGGERCVNEIFRSFVH